MHASGARRDAMRPIPDRGHGVQRPTGRTLNAHAPNAAHAVAIRSRIAVVGPQKKTAATESGPMVTALPAFTTAWAAVRVPAIQNAAQSLPGH